MIEVADIIEDSIAQDIGIESGDKIISINGNDIKDSLDLHYYEGVENVRLVFQKDRQNYEIEIEKENGRALGINPVRTDMRTCSNNCIFCFIKQNPPGMRRQIYFCDEDYRYSFLQGNFVTLTDVEQEDLDRIAEQKLSPLYISVHATDPETREYLFQYKEKIPILEKLEFLAKHDIEMHAQIVLVPGVNDGTILEKTIEDLSSYKKSIKSVAIVPVGLTKHRRNLPEIKPVKKELAQSLLKKSKVWQKKYRNNEGENFVYLADELYLLADEDLPDDRHYADYYQIENGVGLARKRINEMLENIDAFDDKLEKPTKVLIVSGELGAQVLKKYLLDKLNNIRNLEADILPIKNNFFGNSVTVSGLITGRDIIEQAEPVASNYEVVLLPPRCINHDGLLLDNVRPREIATKIGTEVVVAGKNLMEKINNVKS